MSEPTVQLRPLTLRSLIFARGFQSVEEFARICAMSYSTMAWLMRGAVPTAKQFAEMSVRLGADAATLAAALHETWRQNAPEGFEAAFEALT